ncbi:MAG: hypothetical protein INR65_11585, partial [Gluconacetobacter diazotrophicus]|nr:hypothetical protein [Gluconacetobacter diazotrophicus]
MSTNEPATITPQEAVEPRQQAWWQQLWRKEDWWAVWVGLCVVGLAYGLFAGG